MHPTSVEREIRIATETETLVGDLAVPHAARGIVLFAHGTGSGRHSPRNRLVARALRGAGLATLLLDLLTEKEEAFDALTGSLRFDVNLLAQRLLAATDRTRAHPDTRHLLIGYFGASTGAAAALMAAARRPGESFAVVSRGGRPDLVRPVLPWVRTPTLLIVGGDDPRVIEVNRAALGELECESSLVIIPGATHLFEERGALEEVARLAAQWFTRRLAAHGETATV